MDLTLAVVVEVVALALLFDFTNGFHDAANSVSTVVATRALPAKGAVWFSAFFNLVAWIVTLPTTIVLAFAALKMTQLPGALGWSVTAIAVAVVGSLIGYAMLHAIRAEDIEAEIPPEESLEVAAEAQPHLEEHGPAA